jgi:hypothetical protein
MGSISGALKGTISGAVSLYHRGPSWPAFKKGFGTGFMAGAVPAFLGVGPYAAAAIAGGLSASGDAMWERQCWQRVIASGIVGGIGGLATNWGLNTAFGNYYDIKLPHSVARKGVERDMKQLYSILVGEAGGTGASAGFNAAWESKKGREVWKAICDFFGWEYPQHE